MPMPLLAVSLHFGFCAMSYCGFPHSTGYIMMLNRPTETVVLRMNGLKPTAEKKTARNHSSEQRRRAA